VKENQVPAEKEVQTYSVPWSVGDTWAGVVLLVLISIGMVAAVLLGLKKEFLQNIGVLFLELVYILPVVLIFAWRRIHWKYLGFGKFSLQTMGLGCGLLIAGYIFILLHNLILYLLKIDTQGDQISRIFSELDSPIWLFLVGVVFAPLVEEMFFRGFLFQGFRQKYGWVTATLLSSFIFAAAHLDPVSFIPTFILGSVLAYIYHRSNSLWPGIIFHLMINAFGLCAVYALSQFPGLIPS
jgi:CAAX protease family protein